MSGDLSGFSMFELFKAESASQAAVLNQGLLAIEANPQDTSHVESLMRAAHSIKGAARIVGLDRRRRTGSRHGRSLAGRPARGGTADLPPGRPAAAGSGCL